MWQKQLKLAVNDVHIWYLDLNLYLDKLEKFKTILSQEELTKAFKFKFEKHQNRFIITRANLRLILSKYINIKPENIEFIYSEKGKPSLAQNYNNVGIEFNLSHSGELALYAVTKDKKIGIDVEKIRTNCDVESIAKRFFCESEYQFISRLPEKEKEKAFYQLWTGKEAYLKATGEGLGGGLDTIELDLESKEIKIAKIKGEEKNVNNWYLYELKMPENYLGSLAVETVSDFSSLNLCLVQW